MHPTLLNALLSDSEPPAIEAAIAEAESKRAEAQAAWKAAVDKLPPYGDAIFDCKEEWDAMNLANGAVAVLRREAAILKRIIEGPREATHTAKVLIQGDRMTALEAAVPIPGRKPQ